MTNDEAINWIINISADIGKAEHRDLWHYEQVLSEIREMLETSQPEQRWIPCSERLPEEVEAIYWICTDGGCQYQCRWTNNIFGRGVGDTWTWKIFDIPQYSKVIAWMPLPEPYQEVK